MRGTIWEKRIPTLLGVFILVIGLITTSFLVKSGIIFIGKAGPKETPENIRITNISDNSFTVSYITKDSVLGSISITKDNEPNTYIDDRDQQTDNVKPYKIHYIAIRDLRPSTKYSFTITSGSTIFMNNEKPFEVTTGNTISDNSNKPSSQKPLVGKVILPDGTNPKEAIIYVAIENTQALSTLVRSDGSYILPLNSAYDQNFISYASFSEESIIKILVLGESSESNVQVLAKQINPVPIITLSKNYDFTTNNYSASSSAETTIPLVQSSFPSFSASPVSNKNPEIATPRINEAFSDQQPLFKGTASPSATVKIIIQSPGEIQDQVTADANGRWSYRPSQKLSPGPHTISIITQDKFGILKTIKQSFIVYASGEQVSQSATPSATPIITLTPTTTPALTISLTPTILPTSVVSLTPTSIITLTPTPTISPIAIMTKPTTKKPDSPGNSSAIITAVGALATTAIGIFLFLLTRGNAPRL